MRKGSRKLKHCKEIDFSPLVPDNPEQPICQKGHGFSSDCMSMNGCPDFKNAWGITLEQLKENLKLEG